MNNNRTKTNKTPAPKQATSDAASVVRAKHIKLGIDVHLDRYVVVRILEGWPTIPCMACRTRPVSVVKSTRGAGSGNASSAA